MKTIQPAQFHSQRGAALFVSLVTLVALTLIAMAAARSSAFELLMSNNSQNQAVALADAENSLVAGEEDLRTNFAAGGPGGLFAAQDTDGYYEQGAVVNLDDPDWTFPVNQVLDINGFVTDEYIVEYLYSKNEDLSDPTAGASTRHFYRISGRGTGPRNTVRVVQTIFATL